MGKLFLLGLIFALVVLLGCLEGPVNNPGLKNVDPAKLAEFNQCVQGQEQDMQKQFDCMEQNGASCLLDPSAGQCGPEEMGAAVEQFESCEAQFPVRDCSNIID